jgi:hypothetical protein
VEPRWRRRLLRRRGEEGKWRWRHGGLCLLGCGGDDERVGFGEKYSSLTSDSFFLLGPMLGRGMLAVKSNIGCLPYKLCCRFHGPPHPIAFPTPPTHDDEIDGGGVLASPRHVAVYYRLECFHRVKRTHALAHAMPRIDPGGAANAHDMEQSTTGGLLRRMERSHAPAHAMPRIDPGGAANAQGR